MSSAAIGVRACFLCFHELGASNMCSNQHALRCTHGQDVMVAEAVAVEAAGVALVGKEVVEETGAAEAAEGVAEAAPALTLAQHLARRLPSTIKLVRLAQAVFVVAHVQAQLMSTEHQCRLAGSVERAGFQHVCMEVARHESEWSGSECNAVLCSRQYQRGLTSESGKPSTLWCCLPSANKQNE
eukprot:1140933-Pelagomonas_calceolata.AAC.15